MYKKLISAMLIIALGMGACSLGGEKNSSAAANNQGSPLTSSDPVGEDEIIPKETTVAIFLASHPTPFPSPGEVDPLFPITMIVVPEALPYDSSDVVEILPVYECPGGCQWLGDFTAGTLVEVKTVSTDGNFCFVEGTSIQGWAVTGWVSCARIEYP